MKLRITLAEIDKIVAKVSAGYLRRCPTIDRDDLLQQGRLTALRACESYDASKGDPEPYLRRAVNFGIRRMVWHDIAPVSGGGHIPEAFRGLRGVTIADEDPLNGVSVTGGVSPEHQAAQNEWSGKVRARIAALDESKVAVVLLEERSVERIARGQQTSSQAIYRKMHRLRGKLRADEEIQRLASER